MNIVFHSLDSNENKVFFRSTGTKKDNVLEFKDKTEKDTTIKITMLPDRLLFYRSGCIKMQMEFIIGEKTLGFYQNELGLEMPLVTLCKSFFIKKGKIELEYVLFMDETPFSSHKIWILFE